jgi:quercetin dioxygenase-like cupin family protein
MTQSEIRSEGMVIFNRASSVAEIPIQTQPGHEHDQGWTTRLVNTAINGSPDLLVSILRLAPNQFHPAHFHPDLGELYFVLEGSCEIRAGAEVNWVRAGTAIYTPKGTAHSIRTKDEGVKVLIVFPEGDLGKIRKVWVD